MSPCGRTDGRTNKQTSENRATQSMDCVRLSFAILTRIPATMSIGRHLMRLQLFQGISFMNHTLWWSDFERRIKGIQGALWQASVILLCGSNSPSMLVEWCLGYFMNTINEIFHLRHSIIWNPYIFHTPPPKYQKGQNTQVLRLLESLGPVTTNTAWKAQKVTL